MRVFVIGTGRCGTVTFSKACSHFNNYTSGHESKTQNNDLVYADNHIECDPHLFWQLPNLIERYPDAIIIHLKRERESCIESLSKRPSLKKYQAFTEMTNNFNANQIATKYYDFCTKTIEHVIGDCMTMNLTPSIEKWTEFCEMIGEVSNSEIEKSFAEWNTKHNRS